MGSLQRDSAARCKIRGCWHWPYWLASCAARYHTQRSLGLSREWSFIGLTFLSVGFNTRHGISKKSRGPPALLSSISCSQTKTLAGTAWTFVGALLRKLASEQQEVVHVPSPSSTTTTSTVVAPRLESQVALLGVQQGWIIMVNTTHGITALKLVTPANGISFRLRNPWPSAWSACSSTPTAPLRGMETKAFWATEPSSWIRLQSGRVNQFGFWLDKKGTFYSDCKICRIPGPRMISLHEAKLIVVVKCKEYLTISREGYQINISFDAYLYISILSTYVHLIKCFDKRTKKTVSDQIIMVFSLDYISH